MTYHTKISMVFSNWLVRLLVATMSSLAIPSLVSAAHFPLSGSASCDFFSLNIQGYTNAGYGPQSFNFGPNSFSPNPGYFLIIRRTGVTTSNPLELLFTRDFQDGALVASMKTPGEFELMTNAIYANNLGKRLEQSNLATVTVRTFQNPGDVYVFNMIASTNFTLPPVNMFIAPGQGSAIGGLSALPGGLGAFNYFGLGSALSVVESEVLAPTQGGGFVFFPTTSRTTIQGQIQVNGSNVTNINLSGIDVAQFVGTYVGSSQCN